MARLRAGWERNWLRESGQISGRAAMLEIYAVLHAASQLLTPRVLQTDLAELLLVHEELGRAATSGLAGQMVLTAEIMERILPSLDPGGCAVPVLAAAGALPLRVERSRPGWHLNGMVLGVSWSPDAERLAVFAVDEGDNDILTVIPSDLARLEISAPVASDASRTTVDIRFDDVPLPGLTHCPGEPARLADALTVLAMADAVGAAGWLLEQPRADAELQLSRATLQAAAASLTSTSVVRRQHDVSAAALLVLPMCLRVASEAASRDRGTLRRVRRIHEQVQALPAWHRDRLLALV